jgi:hypothetical protein
MPQLLLQQLPRQPQLLLLLLLLLRMVQLCCLIMVAPTSVTVAGHLLPCSYHNHSRGPSEPALTAHHPIRHSHAQQQLQQRRRRLLLLLLLLVSHQLHCRLCCRGWSKEREHPLAPFWSLWITLLMLLWNQQQQQQQQRQQQCQAVLLSCTSEATLTSALAPG